MITHLSGILHDKKAPIIIIDVNGVGYELQAPMSTFYQLPSIGESITLFTHLSIREDAHTLFGFYQEQERQLFRALIKVNGIGPKLALSVLSGIEPDQFIQCIQTEDAHSLTTIPGIGKKTAERLIIETRDTIAKWQCASPKQGTEDAVSALTALGYKPAEAKNAIAKVYQSDHNSEQLIRSALQYMVRRP